MTDWREKYLKELDNKPLKKLKPGLEQAAAMLQGIRHPVRRILVPGIESSASRSTPKPASECSSSLENSFPL